MQKCGKILVGRKDTLAPVVSTLRGRAPPSPRRSDASVSTNAKFGCCRYILCVKDAGQNMHAGRLLSQLSLVHIT